MVDWGEIQQLQADLEKIQETTTTQRLSERNCIEILMKLEEMKLIDVLHSSDGKEYLTPNHLLKEIRQEVDAHDGRINTIDVQSLLNVDFSIIEKSSQELVKTDKEVQLVNGQLITTAYLDFIADEINDNLQAQGHVTMAELSHFYDLPGDFLSKEISNRIGKNIEGELERQQRNTIYTDSFIAKHKCRIRGMLSGATRPLSIGSMCNQDDLTSQLAAMIIRELMRDGRVKGQLSGGASDTTTFAPQIYSQTQSNWIDDFFKQNDYIEYATAMKLGGVDATSQLRKRLSRYDPVYLKTVCVGTSLVDQAAALVEDTVTNNEWTDVTTLLPSSFSDDDVRQLLEHVTKTCKDDVVILCDVIVTSRRFIDLCLSYFDAFIAEKAEKEVSKATVLSVSDEQWKELVHRADDHKKADKRGDRRRRAHEGSGSSKRSADYGGAGQGGREVKSKGSDKKRLRWQKEHEESKKTTNKATKEEGIELNHVESVLRDRLNDCPDPMIQEIASKLIEPVNTKYEAAVKSVFVKRQAHETKEKSGVTKRSRKEMEEEVNKIWSTLQMFSGSFTYFSDDNLSVLYKHLLQEPCMQLVDLLFLILQTEFAPTVNVPSPLTDKIRISLLPKFPENMRPPMTRLNKLLVGKNYESFVEALKEAASPAVCEVMLKNLDKKKEKQLSHNYKMSLLKNLEEVDEPATCFHAAITVIFQSITGCVINIPGKLVPVVLQKLKDFLDRDVFVELLAYQEQVMKLATKEAAEQEAAKNDLIAGLPRIKELAVTLRKKSKNN